MKLNKIPFNGIIAGIVFIIIAFTTNQFSYFIYTLF